MSQFFSNFVVSKLLTTIIIAMHNFVAKVRKICEICKQYAGNLVNPKSVIRTVFFVLVFITD